MPGLPGESTAGMMPGRARRRRNARRTAIPAGRQWRARWRRTASAPRLARIEHVDAVEGGVVDVGPDEVRGLRPSRSPICTTCSSGTSGAGTPGHRVISGSPRPVASARSMPATALCMVVRHNFPDGGSRCARRHGSATADPTVAARPARRAAPRNRRRPPVGNCASRRGLFDLVGELEIEAPQRMAIAQQRAGLRTRRDRRAAPVSMIAAGPTASTSPASLSACGARQVPGSWPGRSGRRPRLQGARISEIGFKTDLEDVDRSSACRTAARCR